MERWSCPLGTSNQILVWNLLQNIKIIGLWLSQVKTKNQNNTSTGHQTLLGPISMWVCSFKLCMCIHRLIIFAIWIILGCCLHLLKRLCLFSACILSVYHYPLITGWGSYCRVTSYESQLFEMQPFPPTFSNMQYATKDIIILKTSKRTSVNQFGFDPLWVLMLWQPCIMSNKSVISHKSRTVTLGRISIGTHGVTHIHNLSS